MNYESACDTKGRKEEGRERRGPLKAKSNRLQTGEMERIGLETGCGGLVYYASCLTLAYFGSNPGHSKFHYFSVTHPM